MGLLKTKTDSQRNPLRDLIVSSKLKSSQVEYESSEFK